MERIKVFIVLLLVFIGGNVSLGQNRYAVYYKYKPQNEYSLSNPQAFLSQRAIQRRVKEGLSADSLDLPVSKKYVDLIAKNSLYLLYHSKWYNASVLVANESQIQEIKNFPFVEKVELMAPGFYQFPGSRIDSSTQFASEPNSKRQEWKLNTRILETAANSYDFQNQLIGIDKMHQEGFTGKGVLVAVFDAGFPGVNTASPFAHLISKSQILGQKNTVKPWQKEVFTDHPHGTNVLSLIAANEASKLVSGAYNSNFILVITEDVFTEYRIEEMNWVRGAEYADSLGVDIINSSVGYIDFDDPTMTYSLKDLDGKTTIISKGAKIASDKGILVVNSVGNYGAGPSSLVAPADVEEVLAIGSVTLDLTVSGFSSRGPTGDGRIKPDLAAFGNSPILILANGNAVASSGTSFSAPQVAALAAGLWEARPDWTRAELVENLIRSGSQFDKPDNLLGFGIPNFLDAYYGEILSVEEKEPFEWKVFPNPLGNEELNIYFGKGMKSEFSLFDLSGKLILQSELERSDAKLPYQLNLSGIKQGFYFVRLQEGNLTRISRLIKN